MIIYVHVLLQNPSEVIFEKGSKSAQLFLTAIDMEHPEYTEELSRQLWVRVWGKVCCLVVTFHQ